MSESNTFTARLLEASSSAYAGAGASLLLETQPDLAERYAPSAFRMWKAHLQQRVLELIAALDADEPRLFSSRIRWERTTFAARDMDERDLRSALVCLRKVLEEELPKAARGAAVAFLDPALQTLDEALQKEPNLDPAKPLERHALEYMETALRGEAAEAIERLSNAVTQGLEIAEAYTVLLTAQREVGRMWHLGDLDVSEEHLVTATTERATAALAQLARREDSNGKTVLVAAAADNNHSLAVRVLADLFEIAGWRAICLGSDVPVADVVAAAKHFKADLLALSVALPTQLKTARQTIEAVQGDDTLDTKILVGGGAFAELPDLWKGLGADGYVEKVDRAVELGGRLVGPEHPQT